MNKLSTLTIAAVFVAGTGLAAMAQHEAPGSTGGTYERGGTEPGTGGAYEGGGTAPEQGSGAMHEHLGTTGARAGEMGEHRMTGTVADINHNSGQLTLKTDAANLQLHFPPQALGDVKQGDRITAQLAFVKGTTP